MIAILALEKMRKAFKLSNLTGKERVLCYVWVLNLFTEWRPGRFHEALWCNDGNGRVMEMLFWQQTLNGKELACSGLVLVWTKLNLVIDIRYRDKSNKLCMPAQRGVGRRHETVIQNQKSCSKWISFFISFFLIKEKRRRSVRADASSLLVGDVA